MIASASEETSRPTSQLGALGVLFTLGRFGQALVSMLLGCLFLLNGALCLGLVGPVAHIDNSQASHWQAATFLVLAGVEFGVGLLTLLNKLNQKAS